MSTELLEATMTDELVDSEAAEHYEDVAATLEENYQGLRITVHRNPQTKQFTPQQKEYAAHSFNADPNSTSMSKKLFDPKIPQISKINKIFAAVDRLREDPSLTLPHPSSGMRLVRVKKDGETSLSMVETIQKRVDALQAELDAAAQEMYEAMPAIRAHMKQKLGRLYEEDAYNFDPRTRLGITVEYPQITVPEYLKQNPKLYAREQARIRGELEQAARLKEAEMADELFGIVDRLIERLESKRMIDKDFEVLAVVTQEDGDYEVTYRKNKTKEVEILTPKQFAERVTTEESCKTFQDSTATRLYDALDYAEGMAKELGLGEAGLGNAFGKLKDALGNQPKETFANNLRNSSSFRETIRGKLAQVAGQVLDSAVLQPQRKTYRRRANSSNLNPDKV